ncbi:MAG: phenylalanine--tRNA ligase subunit beta [Planctomycetes bacterium]|nr:phenylalanine--tRNA ligase subunit beta [Planctomycetota bacterium]
MKLSYRWLARHVDLSGLTPEQIRNDLTLSTAEIEAVEPFGQGLDEIVVGHVLERRKHPEADKLSVTRVDAGQGEALQIVCGAPNVAAGQSVAVVLPGRRLPDGTRIGKAKLRGIESFGMICSERELGLSDEHEGILVLEPGARPGTRFVDAVPVADHVLEIDNKSINHRPDLWGHHGFARELAAIYGRELHAPVRRQALPADGTRVVLSVEDPADCPRYLGLVLAGLKVQRSPAWLRYLLRAVGQRPINNLVDATNFVMLDLGQPLHAFDLRMLSPQGVHVRRARPGETMHTLDGQERRLEPVDLLITSGGEAVALAGVMGGARSAVADDTSTIFLESATFHPTRIRRTSTRLGLRTEASSRYEKALDPALAEDAVHRMAELLAEVSPGAHAAGPMGDATGWRFAPRTIRLRKARLDHKLGVTLPVERVESIFRGLRFGVQRCTEGLDVGIPSWRATKDLTIEDDLIEEVGRMHRFDNIPPVPLTGTVALAPREPELFLAQRALRVAAAELGCHEVYHYSFVPDALLAACRADGQEYLRVANPVAPEITRMRRHVLPSTLGAVAQNLRVQPEVRLMEHGKGYQPERRDAHGLPHEVRELGIVWARNAGAEPYPELRSRVLGLCARLGAPATAADLHPGGDLAWIHPGRTVALRRGERAFGYVGVLHPHVAANLGIPPTTAIATLDLRALLAAGVAEPRFVPIPRFPSQPVDVALLAPSGARAGDLARFLREVGDGMVRDVVLFEAYRGAGLPPGTKSLNFTVTLGAEDRTLTAADEEAYLMRVRQRCAGLGVTLRG